MQFSCDPDDAPQCPEGYSCEADGCCHLDGSDFDENEGACQLGGLVPPTAGTDLPTSAGSSSGDPTSGAPVDSTDDSSSGTTADFSGTTTDPSGSSGTTAGGSGTTAGGSGTTASR
ncbi:MAG: hypothetical protein AAGF11_17390 [Myxococcota bacterium]